MMEGDATQESIFIKPCDDPIEIDPAAGRSYFKDGIRRIDFIIEYEESPAEEPHKTATRQMYLTNLQKEGLELETVYLASKGEYGTFDEKENESESKVAFIKIHAPFSVLCKYAQKNKMKFPVGPNDIIISDAWYQGSFTRWLARKDPFIIKKPQFKEPETQFVEVFEVEKIDQFTHARKSDGSGVDEDAFFTSGQRSRLVKYILSRTLFGEEETQFGYKQLKYNGVIMDVYPLHEGRLKRDNDNSPPMNVRQKLKADWASSSRIFKYQPISAIREYFGEKIALYFAWIGLYTSFLVPAAIVGFLCFLYGCFTIPTDIPTKEKCESPKDVNGSYLFYMCPLCAKICPYFFLNTSCMYSKLTRAFDNEATIFFAIFMALWATLFLEFWKRKQVTLAYEWHTMDFEEVGEQPRPEYKLYANHIITNQITKKEEVSMSSKQKYLRLVGSYSIVAFFLAAVLSALLAVIIFRAAMLAVLSQQDSSFIRARAAIIVSATAACFNLICINILKLLYGKVADKLTDWENPRTLTEYEDSYTVKMFWFQFANTYASIFYVAFFKSGSFTGTPANQKKFAGAWRLEGCNAEGCFVALTIQLIIIMVGQQIIGNVKEILIPYIKKKWLLHQAKKNLKTNSEEATEIPQWVADHSCEETGEHDLFEQYLEIVLQYGFVTMFVAAFPLAPFFALLNNLIEIRLDAINFVQFYRRPVAERAEDIGAWYGILATMTTFSTIVSAFVLAFTSDAIPRMAYVYYFSVKLYGEKTLRGYTNFTLSYFNVSDFSSDYAPSNATITGSNIPEQSFCRYPGYFDPEEPYDHSKAYWVILAARLGFVISFQALVLTVTWVVAYIIPDMPEALVLKLRREEYLIEKKEREKEKQQ